MISNYLEFVKYQRKFSIEDARIFLKTARLCKNDWGRGYYDGLAQAKSLEAWHWRRLQKDIEAHEKCGDTLGWANESMGFNKSFLPV